MKMTIENKEMAPPWVRWLNWVESESDRFGKEMLKRLEILFWINRREVNTAPPMKKNIVAVVESSKKGIKLIETRNIIIAKSEEK